MMTCPLGHRVLTAGKIVIISATHLTLDPMVSSTVDVNFEV